MAKRRKRRSLPFSPARLEFERAEPRKRSYQVPLLALGAAALIGFPLLRDATSDPMLRNVYSTRSSCECDYGQLCARNDEGRWVGPWYAKDPEHRHADDPGSGGTCRDYSPGGSGSYYGYRGEDSKQPPIGVERGHRGGFGGTGRVRSAAS